MCQKSSDPFHIASYYIKWVTTSWTYSMSKLSNLFLLAQYKKKGRTSWTLSILLCSSDPFYIVSYYIKWITTSWTFSICLIIETLIPDKKLNICFAMLNADRLCFHCNSLLKTGSFAQSREPGQPYVQCYGSEL